MDWIYIALFKASKALYIYKPLFIHSHIHTHWWRQATVVATAALGQTDRSEAGISRHRPLWLTPVGRRVKCLAQGHNDQDRDKHLGDSGKGGTICCDQLGDLFSQFQEFLKGTKKHYNAELESVDFKGNAEEARVHINSWVEKQTQDKIKDLLSQDAVGSLTKLVLVNAIYFKGSWNTQFKEEKTADVHFRLNKNDTKPVKMMQQKSKFPFATIPEANCKILEMPYKGNDLSMLIFLPNDIEDDTTGLEKLEKELTYQNFVDWTRPDMSPNEVDVKLPRFKMEKYDLEKILTNMGMENAFDIYKRDFSGMSPANDLIVSKVVHKAFVDVNEEGAEAAAATGVDMEIRSIMIPAEFVADHPFIFFIRHKPTKSILFVGRYCSPE
uniref:Serpin B6 n=1 Tax=Maylandia zebra TaxID=106582 RepID=A0A3P9C3A7_9CICH